MSKQGKHTPGPWRCTQTGVVYDTQNIPLKFASGWKEDAWYDENGTEETRANARLIAKAWLIPEVRELLERLFDPYENVAAIKQAARSLYAKLNEDT